MAKRVPNKAMQELLNETDWTHRQLALTVNRIGTERGTPTNYHRQSVAHWLHGHVPMEETRPLIREAFARGLGRPVTYAELGLVPPKGEPNDCADIVEGLVDLAGRDMHPSRRGVLSASLYPAALAIPAWDDIAGRMDTVKTGRTRRIGLPDVDAVLDVTKRVSDMDDERGGRYARPWAAHVLVEMVAPCLRAEAPDHVRKAMFSAAADLCYRTGYMAWDERLHGLAAQYYVKALELSAAAEDRLMHCATLRTMSFQAVDLGQGPRAMWLADAAATLLPEETDPRMRAFVAGQRAHAAAQIGDRRSAAKYVNEAETALGKAGPQEKRFGSYYHSSHMYVVSHVQHFAGNTRKSAESLEESNRLRRSRSLNRNQVLNGFLLAERHFSVGFLEEACGTWDRALDSYRTIQSGRGDERVLTMLSLISPYTRNHTAAALYERARTVIQPALWSRHREAARRPGPRR
ncbi:tetratricopeptide repeat protein [Streptomyces sp. B1866]|uniref:tetratricopeptide repeat protein n=1 Tax=Streptomyces sp. B1866 TaxID=3075431 RepID=UPI002890D153|nr:tetratricopeptide repeat protein [Streptomyces sp. B1866]MDT3398635.1 tetratricopeptide repeat protein [Streptomyces sp. B1866]